MRSSKEGDYAHAVKAVKTVFARIRKALVDCNHHIRGFDDGVNIFSL